MSSQPNFKVDDTVVAVYNGTEYKSRILKCSPHLGGWKYFVHYDQWRPRYDVWLDDHKLRPFSEVDATLKWPALGIPLAKNSVAVSPAKGKKNGKAEVSVQDSEEKKRSDSMKALQRRRAQLLERNLLEEDSVDAPSKNSNSAKITIPVTLKKILLKDWENISNEPKKLVRIPHSVPVNVIIDDFLAFKKEQIESDSTSNSDMFESYRLLFWGMSAYFNSCLPIILLYRQERTQLKLLRDKLVQLFNINLPDDVIFNPGADQNVPNYSDVYGIEHLLRLFVRIPTLLGNVCVSAFDYNQIVQRLNEFLKFVAKGLNKYSPAPTTEAPFMSTNYMTADEMLAEMKKQTTASYQQRNASQLNKRKNEEEHDSGAHGNKSSRKK